MNKELGEMWKESRGLLWHVIPALLEDLAEYTGTSVRIGGLRAHI